MSNVSAFAIFVLVLSPLLLPLTISGVHAIAKWRRNLRTALEINTPKSRAVTSDGFLTRSIQSRQGAFQLSTRG